MELMSLILVTIIIGFLFLYSVYDCNYSYIYIETELGIFRVHKDVLALRDLPDVVKNIQAFDVVGALPYHGYMWLNIDEMKVETVTTYDVFMDYFCTIRGFFTELLLRLR